LRVQKAEYAGIAFIECVEDITQIGDALEIITACIENETNLLLVDTSRLPDEFFDLSSGFAGEFLQKMQNYRVRVAAVIPTDHSHSPRFREFLAEARTGRTFRAFGDRESAEVWLTND
jgi:hypothetical protein